MGGGNSERKKKWQCAEARCHSMGHDPLGLPITS